MLALTKPVPCPAPLGLSCAVPTEHSSLKHSVTLHVFQFPTCIIPFSGYGAEKWDVEAAPPKSQFRVPERPSSGIMLYCSPPVSFQSFQGQQRKSCAGFLEFKFRKRNKSPFRHHATSPAQANSCSLWREPLSQCLVSAHGPS